MIGSISLKSIDQDVSLLDLQAMVANYSDDLLTNVHDMHREQAYLRITYFYNYWKCKLYVVSLPESDCFTVMNFNNDHNFGSNVKLISLPSLPDPIYHFVIAVTPNKDIAIIYKLRFL